MLRGSTVLNVADVGVATRSWVRGARLVRARGPEDDFVVPADPDGDEFCIVGTSG